MTARSLYFAVLTTAVDAMSSRGLEEIVALDGPPWVELFEDREVALGQARMIARTSADGKGWLIRCAIDEDHLRTWRRHDWRVGEIDESDRESLCVNVEDLADFSQSLTELLTVEGAYE